MTMSRKNRMSERGTLLIEAIAMLGLIALVTPTLYKKSAERLQEIQDINAAGQVRILNKVIETFIKSEFGDLATATSSSPYVVELNLNDSSGSGYYQKGYSSYVPYGYIPGDIKNYGVPRVFVRNDEGKLISYILFPAQIDPGKKRAARMASLVGANGGIVTKPFTGGNDLQADGTGGAWALDKDMLQDLISHGASSATSALIENSLMVTSTEPIVMMDEDSEKFLYRVPPDNGDYFHNTMVTNLYMGGMPEGTGYATHSQQFHSIYNVRRLTLNTDCNYSFLNDGDSSRVRMGGACEPEVADLYIGKPFGAGSSGTLGGNTFENGFQHSGNTGAAWIYGNLSALKDSFRLFREGSAGSRGINGYNNDMERTADGYDVLEFARMGTDSSGTDAVDFSVFRAQNSDTSAEVAMLDNFMVAKMGSSNVPEFWLGKSGGAAGNVDGSLIYATGDDLATTIDINGHGEVYTGARTTNINRQGGTVYINGSSVAGGRGGDTYINDGGGQLQAGKQADWILAEGENNSSNLYLLRGAGVGGTDARKFAVGNSSSAENHMIWANSSTVSLRGGLLRAYSNAKLTGGSNFGGRENIAQYDSEGPAAPAVDGLDGQIALTSKYTDVLGSAYFGIDNMSSGVDGLNYSRDNWRVGVAGSAWVDDLLFARDAWFHRSGFRELHAGFSSYTAYNDAPEKGWLNVYDDKVVIRDPAVASSGASGHLDTMFYADDSRVRIFDKQGGAALFEDGMAKIGYTPNESSFSNLFVADSWSANVIGSSLVKIYTGTDTTSSKVNIQENAMLFSGHGGDLASTEARSNTIEARAGQFAIQTANKGQDIEDNMQFYIDKDEARVKYVNLGVYDDNSAAVFQVMPNEDFASGGSANVQVRGSFHVTGNQVLHVASSADNRAGNDDTVGRDTDAHAMLEVDPEYVQIWAKDGENYAKGTGYFAMLKVDPTDIYGGAVSSAVMDDTSIYIRRGAIELEKNVSGSSYAADEGFGYIKANRLVSNVSDVSIPAVPADGYTRGGAEYDQYMVNPAYTSVMHDIKLTTRGGARLSDILPDYVLKGVYNLTNNRREDNQAEVDNMDTWAHPYLGVVPYAVCPPGYRNLATVVPISFRMGEAGDIMLAKDRFSTGLSGSADKRYIVNPSPRHAKNLAYAVGKTGGRVLQDLTLQRVSSIVYNEVYKSASSFADFQSMMQLKTEGWFWGLDALHTGSSWSDHDMVSELYTDTSQGVQFWSYEQDKGNSGATKVTIPTPIYFQQNTWLKTSLVPDDQGWKAYMGFLYNMNDWSNVLGGVAASGTVKSNYNPKGYNEGSSDVADIPGGDGNFVWNMFPVPTYSLEGHGTVYCYFDRKAFYDKDNDWKNYIDNIDQLGSMDGHTSETGATFRALKAPKDSSYTTRLNDPSLKYDDPW